MSPERKLPDDYEACLKAVHRHFRHLSRKQIDNPPPTMPDAFLARQLALYILVNAFGYPRRRVCIDLDIGRGNFAHRLTSVAHRLPTPEFDQAYQEMAANAQQMGGNNG